MSENELFGVKFDSCDVDEIIIKRDGRTITIRRDGEKPLPIGFSRGKEETPEQKVKEKHEKR